jgi:signal transduction histidine kinase
MVRQPKRSLTIHVEGAGVAGEVSAIDTQGARLRSRERPTLPGEGETVELRFTIATLELQFSVSAAVRSISMDEERSIALVHVEFEELSDAGAHFIATCQELQALSLAQAEALVLGLFDPAVVMDLEWRVLHFNTPYIRLSGVRPRALQGILDSGTRPFEIITDDPGFGRQLASEAIQSARAVHLAQTNISNMAGDVYLGTLSYIPVLGPFGHVIALIQTFRDESAENRMQEHYKQLLEFERRRAERMTKLVTGLAHQINTPLGIINTAGSLIDNSLDSPVAYISEYEAPDKEELDELFNELRESAMLLEKNVGRVNTLVNKVKDLSSAQLSAQREAIDLGVAIEESIITVSREMRLNGVKANFDWERDDAFPWDGYPDHLTRVIRELVHNAIVHAYADCQGGVLDIRIISLDRHGRYQLEMTDYGKGIHADMMPQIFEPFVTGTPAKATGLGLAIVENIVTNLLGGKIACTSEPDKSTTFAILLPKKVPQAIS